MAQVLSLLLAAVLVAVDQLTKYWAIAHLKGQPPLALWPGVFELQYCDNPGVAFSLLENQRWIFIPVTVLVMLLVLVVLFRSRLCRYRTFRLSCALILAGGIGNLIDRIAYAHVTDFLYLKLIDFPIFNFADCCVTVGAVLLFVFLLFLYKEPEELPLRTLLFGIPAKAKAPKDDRHGQ